MPEFVIRNPRPLKVIDGYRLQVGQEQLSVGLPEYLSGEDVEFLLILDPALDPVGPDGEATDIRDPFLYPFSDVHVPTRY